MSVTFCCPAAPKIPNPAYGEDPYEPREISIFTDVDMGNHNASAVLEILGLGDSLYGSVSADNLSAAIARGNEVLSDSNERAAFIEPPSVNGRVVTNGSSIAAAMHERIVSRSKGCTVVSMGRSDDAIVRNVMSLMGLFRKAREAGLDVYWG